LGDEPDDTIVNPENLAHERSTEVCGQCHGVHFFRTSEELETWKREGYSFRPGAELADSMAIVRGRFEDNDADVRRRLAQQPGYLENWFWRDGTVRVAGREFNGMLETPCYQRGEMSCLSCHALHRPEDDPRSFQEWTDDQLGVGTDGRSACVPCHTEYADEERVVEHTRHPADSSGSDCYNCHMPFTSYGLLKAVRSHVVASPDVAVSLATGRPNACNQCHLDRTLRWAAEHLEAWYGIEQPALTTDEETVPASILWALRGDAAQRALMAWSFGWEDARAASGTGWMVPFLGVLMADPYDAVRFIAQRSLRSYPGFREFEQDANMVPGREEQIELMKRFIVSLRGRTPEPLLDKVIFDRLLGERDQRPVILFE
ncbi:MAG: C cytochrome precursor, partial [Planctomycetota bacterium]|nr:C cytochrome precursor [Planctomycetota bacterium]